MASRIQELWQKVKSAGGGLLEEWGIVLIILLTAFGSFGFGRISAGEASAHPVAVRIAPEATEPRGMHIGGLIVASKTGEVYHYPWCPGASQMKRENQVWFADEAAARKAGYAPSKNCAGLGEEKSEVE